ncbi:MAG: polysaccharide deacetylase family protein, partial [Candidatus Cloacimonetes bacterium]|nr:polysaccharide deacetylase family protein [Candidatus Cloacimonadota bacterium]
MQVFRSIRLIILLFLLPGGCDFPPSSWDGRTKIAITFDDQHESVYTVALPMMQEYGFRATNFINTAHMGMTGCYGWTEAEELELVHGWETGGHTLHHYNLPTLDPETLEQEIYQDWLNLKDHGLSHESFALPAGHATEEQFLLINRYYRNI